MPTADTLFAAARKAFAARNLTTAEQICRSIIETAPRDSRPWSLLSDAALRRGRPDVAIGCADKAVALGPRDPLAHLMRAKCLVASGRLRAALDAAERGMQIKACPPAALDGFGAIFSMLGQHARALGLFKRAVAAEPRNPQFLFNLAATERMAGALVDAERHCDRLLALEPHYYPAHYIRADLREQTPARNHVAEMEALIAGGLRSASGEVMLRFALGKECEDLGDYARGFRHLKAGTDLHRRQLRYDVRSDIAVIDSIIRTYIDAAFKAATGGFDQEAPIFIVGLPRSGTTLVERIVAAHSAVVSAGELGAFPAQLMRAAGGQAAAGGAWVGQLRVVDLTALGQAYVAAARETGLPEGCRFIDKFPQNYLYCGAIHAALPKAKIILLKRRPMDTCFALYKAHFAGTYPFSYELTELAEYFLAFRRLTQHWRRALPAQVLLEVAYEDIVTDLEHESRRILAFLDLPWEDEVLRFHASKTPSTTASAVQIRRPIYASSIGKWRHYAAELAPLRARLAAVIPEAEIG